MTPADYMLLGLLAVIGAAVAEALAEGLVAMVLAVVGRVALTPFRRAWPHWKPSLELRAGVGAAVLFGSVLAGVAVWTWLHAPA